MGPAAALDLATIGCGAPLGLASGIAANTGSFYGGGGCAPAGGCCHMGMGGMGSVCGGDPCQGSCQVPVIARPILPYFRSTSRGFPKW